MAYAGKLPNQFLSSLWAGAAYDYREGEVMRLTEVIAVWEELHQKNTGDLGYCDLEHAIEKVVGIQNDVPGQDCPNPKERGKHE